MFNKMPYKDLFYIIIATIFITFSYLIFDKIFFIFSDQSLLITKLFTVILGSIITVGIMTIMLKLQADHNKEKEFLSQLFDKKLAIYREFLQLIFIADDDNVIDKEEIQKIENIAGEICLLAKKETTEVLAQFIYQLKVYGVIYFRSLTQKQIYDFCSLIQEEKRKSIEKSILTKDRYNSPLVVKGNEVEYFVSLDELIQAMRNGLDVIKGDISNTVENFILLPYDARKIMSNPNIVD